MMILAKLILNHFIFRFSKQHRVLKDLATINTVLQEET